MSTFGKHIGTAAFSVLLACAGVAAPASASPGGTAKQPVMVGGAAMYPSRNIVQNASHAKNLSTLVAAVKAAGLVDTLSGKGPFTVFAPTNAAFDALPPGTVNSLLKPANKAKLVKILTYHVVAGDYDAAALMHKIQSGGGTAKLTTVEGEPLTFSIMNGHVMVTDVHGGTATVTTANVTQSNGVVHVIDKVLMP